VRVWLGQFNWPDRFLKSTCRGAAFAPARKLISSRVALMGTNGTDMATAPVSAARREAVDRARQSWIRKLIDLSRRNNLLYCRPLKTSTLDLTSAESSGMATLLSGAEPVSIEKLLPNGKDESVTDFPATPRLLLNPKRNITERSITRKSGGAGRREYRAHPGSRPQSLRAAMWHDR
jgi:hypothetical protein